MWSSSLWVVNKQQSRQDKESYLREPILRTGCPNALLWCCFMSYLPAFLLSVWFSANRKKKHMGKEKMMENMAKNILFLKTTYISKLHCGKKSKTSETHPVLIHGSSLKSSEKLEKERASGFFVCLFVCLLAVLSYRYLSPMCYFILVGYSGNS